VRPQSAAASACARIAVVTTTGGGTACVVDRLGTLAIETFTPDAAFRRDARRALR
jgi:hypothetical protein